MSRDIRQYAQQTNIRLGIGFVILLIIVGIGLIYFFYGQIAALMGLACLVIGLLPLLLISLSLWLIGEIVRKNREV
jgi:hypothetical protein